MATKPVDSPLPWSEFELIDAVFAPLARRVAGAFDLKDDVATFAPRNGYELVLKTDSTIENVHFFPADPPDTVAQKALRRTLSDLAAKGAEPEAYLLAIALTDSTERSWLEQFAQGLARDQEEFGIGLAGGETNRTPGPCTITVTTVGWIPDGRLLRRSGAALGDDIWVTGTIGDAAGGLAKLRANPLSQHDRLVARFRVPEPRLSFGRAFRALASAAIDVSDGLLADIGHVAEASEVRIEIDSNAVPLSSDLRACWGAGEQTVLRAVSAGDDYEIAFAAPIAAAHAIRAAARHANTPVTVIGRVVEGGSGVILRDSLGREISVPSKGYRHF